MLKFALQDELEESLHRRLYEQSTRDHLVDAHSRQYLIDNLDAAFATATRRDRPLSTLMQDIDRFKRINDTWGHLAGDFVLKGIAELIQERIRTEDVFARFGGEEFVLLLTESDREASLLVAERIRSRIEAKVFDYEGECLGVTISIGVATYTGRNYPTPKDLIGAADSALYEAKRSGRNRVVWSERAATIAPQVDPTQ